MDGDPLVPKETTPCRKALIWVIIFCMAAFLLAVLIVTAIKGGSNGHAGNYVVAIALAVLVIGFILMYRWLPHDSLDDRVHYVLYFQAVVFMLLAAGILMMSFNTTKCDKCPECPDVPVNKCFLGDATVETWFNMADCFNPNQAKNFILVSQDKTCPEI